MKSYLTGGSRIRDVYSAPVLDALAVEAGLDTSAVLSADDLRAGRAADADALFSTWGMPALSVDEIRRALPRLGAVYYAAGSVQAFARPFLECGVRVFSAWGANAVPVVEFTVAQIILANKGFHPCAALCRNRVGHDAAFRRFQGYPGNYGCRVGILGAGMIGREVVRRLVRGYRLDVLIYDPFYSEERAREDGARKASLEDIFSTCQTISNHIANLPATVGMLRYEHFSRMLPNATFLNTGRGAQVVEPDLVRALREEPGRTAILDVTFPEPPAAGSPLYALPNVVLTPHIAGSAGDEVHRMAEYMLDEFRRVSAGAASLYEVTPRMLDTMA